MADMAHFAGLVAAGIHPSPVPHCEFVTTTTHKTLRGPRGGMILFREAHAKTINASVFPGNQGGPLMHVIAAKAVALKEASSPEFRAYQRQVVANAQALGQGLVRRGFRLASGGTDNHLLLVDLRGTELSGKVAQETLDKARITVNKHAVPFDPRRFTTYERVDEVLPMVVKKDGRREPFDRQKIVSGLKRACEKRPVSVDAIEAVVDKIERQLQERGERELESREIGEAVMRELHALDAVAYVCFASVYRSFRDVHEFMRELEDLIAERRRTPRRRRAARGAGRRSA